MAVPLLAALFLEINALIIALMIVAFLAHEATALWDVSYAVTRREVTPFEQRPQLLEMLPLMSAAFVAVLHWPQFLALFGAGPGAGALRPDLEAGAAAGGLYRRRADRGAAVRTAALSRGAVARPAHPPALCRLVPVPGRGSAAPRDFAGRRPISSRRCTSITARCRRGPRCRRAEPLAPHERRPSPCTNEASRRVSRDRRRPGLPAAGGLRTLGLGLITGAADDDPPRSAPVPAPAPRSAPPSCGPPRRRCR